MVGSSGKCFMERFVLPTCSLFSTSHAGRGMAIHNLNRLLSLKYLLLLCAFASFVLCESPPLYVCTDLPTWVGTGFKAEDCLRPLGVLEYTAGRDGSQIFDFMTSRTTDPRRVQPEGCLINSGGVGLIICVFSRAFCPLSMAEIVGVLSSICKICDAKRSLGTCTLTVTLLRNAGSIPLGPDPASQPEIEESSSLQLADRAGDLYNGCLRNGKLGWILAGASYFNMLRY